MSMFKPSSAVLRAVGRHWPGAGSFGVHAQDNQIEKGRKYKAPPPASLSK